VLERIVDLRVLLARDVTVARNYLAQHVEKITLNRKGKIFVAAGTWNLLGCGISNGAGGPAWTERLPVRFEWLVAA
jgi:hypothetical protein